MADNPAKLTPDVLYRSQIEITRILLELSRRQIPIYAELRGAEEEQLFLSQASSIDHEGCNSLVAYCTGKPLNSLVMKARALKLKASYRMRASCSWPANRLVSCGRGRPRCNSNRCVLLHYHHEYARLSVPRQAHLRCLVNTGDDLHEEMQVIDISLDGMGCILQKGAAMSTRGPCSWIAKFPCPAGRSPRLT